VFRGVLILIATIALGPVSARAAEPPLVQAAEAGDAKAVRALLIQKGQDVNARGSDGATALHWMVRAEDLDAVDRLLRAGAQPSIANALARSLRRAGFDAHASHRDVRKTRK